MSDEDTFIRALRERPDDETTRLVYTDWLDDRSDPRADYLRTEAAWIALQPSDEQYRPLYRRVSQLAAKLEPEWFATVSRMGHRARSEWDRVEHLWHPHRDERTLDPVGEYLLHVEEIRKMFLVYVGERAAQQFCVPLDYRAFLLTVGGGWHRNHEWVELYAARRSRDLVLRGAEVFSGDVPIKSLEMWTEIGCMGDMHSFMLCCDLDCPRFGEVAEAEDYHPWMGSGSEPLRARGDTFLQFLAGWLLDY